MDSSYLNVYIQIHNHRKVSLQLAKFIIRTDGSASFIPRLSSWPHVTFERSHIQSRKVSRRSRIFVQSLNLLLEHYKRALIQLFSEYRFNYLNSKNRFNYLNSKTNQPHSQAFPPPVLDCSQYAPLGDHVRKVIIISCCGMKASGWLGITM